ncbi:MAG: hypothetical protein AAB276_05685, partial [Pseudomonadota bacterium]
DLSFYPGHRFLDIADHSHIPAARRFLIEKDEHYTVIDFTNMPFYGLNSSVPIKLTKETLGDYTRFFFQFVRGRHGRFLIVESVDDIQWREEPPPAARRAIGKLITPMTLIPNDTPNGPYHLLAQMVFKDSLFQSDITVTETGMVSLSNEKLMIEDLPVLDDVFGQ